MFSTPEPSYHGVVFTDAMGPAAYIARARVVALRNTGSALSPFNAFLVLQGLQTLVAAHGTARGQRHGRRQASRESHDQVEWVTLRWPGELALLRLWRRKYTGGMSFAALLTFGIQGRFRRRRQVL